MPSKVLNGKLICHKEAGNGRFPVNTTCNFICDSFYKLVGSDDGTITCLTWGNWSKVIPWCEPG